MSIETLESSDASFPIESVFPEKPSSIWNGREVHVLEEKDSKIQDQKEKMYASFIHADSPKKMPQDLRVLRFAEPASKSWNFESFPIPPTKPILAPISDAKTCEE